MQIYIISGYNNVHRRNTVKALTLVEHGIVMDNLILAQNLTHSF
jgi:hypothetical protein